MNEEARFLEQQKQLDQSVSSMENLRRMKRSDNELYFVLRYDCEAGHLSTVMTDLLIELYTHRYRSIDLHHGGQTIWNRLIKVKDELASIEAMASKMHSELIATGADGNKID